MSSNATNMKFNVVNKFFKATKLLKAPTVVVNLFIWWPMISLQLSIPIVQHCSIVACPNHNCPKLPHSPFFCMAAISSPACLEARVNPILFTAL